MNSDQYEFFATIYMTPGQSAWCLVSGPNVLSNKYMADPKAYRLEISGPGLRFIVIHITVQTQTRPTVSCLSPETETKSDQSSFSGQSHVNEKEEIYGGQYKLTPV